jgi:putative membrane protein
MFFNAVLVVWHVPFFFDLTLEERGVHITEHLMFVATAMVMWWPVLSPLPELPRASYLVQMAYLFLLPTVPSILGAVITFADDILYSWYATAPRVWGMSPHTDQQLGGIIMWIPGGLAFLCTLVVVFLIWATDEERESRLPQSAPRERSRSI